MFISGIDISRFCAIPCTCSPRLPLLALDIVKVQHPYDREQGVSVCEVYSHTIFGFYKSNLIS